MTGRVIFGNASHIHRPPSSILVDDDSPPDNLVGRLGWRSPAAPETTRVVHVVALEKPEAIMTAQVHERLILDGVHVGITCFPPVPTDHVRVVVVAAGSKGPRSDDEWLAGSTACWRRYIGTWEVRRERLYLSALVGCYELTAGGPVPADWVTAVLCVPRGEPLRYVHMGFESVFAEELHLRVEAGRVTGRRVVRYDADGEVVQIVYDGRSSDPGDWPDEE